MRAMLILLLCSAKGFPDMNNAMNKHLFTACLIGSASLLALMGCSAAQTPQQPPLAGARLGGSITLTDQNGQRFSDTGLAGRYRLIYFGYSFCPDVCPVDLNWLMLGLRQFERLDPARAARVQPIFITVDPARDTPQVLGSFVAQFHPRLIGLTGSEAEISDVAAKYLVQYERQPGSRADAYIVSHTQLAYLMGPAGEPLALIPVDNIATADVNEGAPDLVAAELARWVR